MKNAVSSAMFVLGACAGAAPAQTDVLYGVGYSSGISLYSFQGAAVTNSAPTAGGSLESGIAVWGDIRTTAAVAGYGPGAQYDLALNWTGTTYAFVGAGQRWDGTTDGTSNYSFQFSGNSMYSYDRDWQNEALVCALPESGMLGITYDRSNGTFWGVSTSYTPSKVLNFNSGGTVLSSFFTTSGTGGEYGLAYESSTDTLWTIDYNSAAPELHQYSKAGANLQNLPVTGFTGFTDVLGIEFDLIPAPGSSVLLALGGLAAARRRRA